LTRAVAQLPYPITAQRDCLSILKAMPKSFASGKCTNLFANSVALRQKAGRKNKRASVRKADFPDGGAVRGTLFTLYPRLDGRSPAAG